MRVRNRIVPWAPPAFLALAVVLGVSILVWLASVPADAYTPAQDRLLDIADWMIKGGIGALLGYAGGRAAARRTGSSS